MINQLSEFIMEFRKLYEVKISYVYENEDDNLLHLTKQNVNPKSLLLIDKNDETIMKELINILNYLFEEGDTGEVLTMSIYIIRDTRINIHPQLLNNLTSYLFQAHLIDLAKKIAKFNTKNFNSPSPQVQAISFLNLSRIYFMLGNFKKSHMQAEKALLIYEPFIFNEMKINQQRLMQSKVEVIILLNGYMLYAKSIQNVGSDQDFNKFYINGSKISRKYLGQNHYISRQFMQNDRSTIYVKRNISSYIGQHKKIQTKQHNIKRISIQVNNLLYSLKQFQTPKQNDKQNLNSSQSQQSKNFLIRSISGSGSQRQQPVKNKISQEPQQINYENMSSPRLRVQSPQPYIQNNMKAAPQIDIEGLIQRKFDNFIQTQNNAKKTDPKISELEKKINDLTKENQKNLQARSEKEREIEDLKDRIQQLSLESSKIKVRLQEQEAMQESLKIMQQSNFIEASPIGQQLPKESMTFGRLAQQNRGSKPLTQSQQKMKNVGRQSTADINNIINTLNQQVEQDDVKETNSISMINDTDITVDQNLTFFDQTDQQKYYQINLSTEMTILKRSQIDGVLYDIQCSMVQRNKELFMKITLCQVHGLDSPISKEKEKTEYIDMQIVKDIIQLIDYHKIVPYSCPLKCITNFKTFVQYLIFPFIALLSQADDEGETKVSIFANAPGLLKDVDGIWILEEQCQVTLHYLEQKIFRLIFQRQVEGKNQSCFIDLQFDQTSLDLFFESAFFDEYEKDEVQEIIKLLENQEIEKSNDTVKMKHRVFCIHSYIVKDHMRLLQFIEKINKDIVEVIQKLFPLKNLNDFFKLLNGLQVQMPNKSQAKIQLCIVKVWDKAMCQRLTIVADNSREQCLELFLSNFYETHSPKNNKVKAEGFGQFTYDQITQKLSLNPSLLDQFDYLLVCNLVANIHSLDTFDKELDYDDYDRYKDNCITEFDFQCESAKRLFLIQGFRIPLTFQYLGINDYPIGIKIQIYDEVTLSEQGVFLTISPEAWEVIKKEENFQAQQKKKPKQKKFKSENKMTKDYYLTRVLQKIGWQIIYEKITIQNIKDRQYACRQLSNKQISYIDRLENLLNQQTTQDYQNKKL